MPKQVTIKEKSLIRRYLIWYYKTTKEELDRIDRKFTQLTADAHILSELLKIQKQIKVTEQAGYKKHIEGFKAYMAQKEKEGNELKFSNGEKKELNASYVYLTHRLQSVEKAMGVLLGKKELKIVQSLYEHEMTRRILESREHK